MLQTSFKGREGVNFPAKIYIQNSNLTGRGAYYRHGFSVMYYDKWETGFGAYDLHTKEFLQVSEFLQVPNFCKVSDFSSHFLLFVEIRQNKKKM